MEKMSHLADRAYSKVLYKKTSVMSKIDKLSEKK